MLAKSTHDFAQYLPWLATIAVKTSLLLLIGLAAGQLLRRASAALRHLIYVASITGVLLLPFASMLLPDLRVPILPSRSNTPNSEHIASAVAESSPAVILHSPRAKAQQPMTRSAKRETIIPGANAETVSSVVGTELVETAQAATHTANWRGILVILWIAGCAGCLLRMFVIHLQLGRLVKESVAVDSIPLSSRLRWLCRDLGIKQEVTLLASHELDVPIAVGVLSPKIVLSPQSGEWSETRRNAVLCHELAHIKRGDALTQLLASLAC